jgi:hypothetical protein
MRSHRGGGLGSWLMAVGFVLLPAFSSTVRAQPGYGPDPFWPYNQQYAPYVSPIGPAGPDAGQGGAMLPQAGFRGANQFQDYLEDLQGGGRNVSDRAGIGMPYYRSAVLPGFDATGRGSRQYRPNTTRVNATFEQAQRTVVDKYYAYYSERDPARRAELIREYREARRDVSRSLSGRARSPSRVLDSSSRLDPGSRGAGRAGSSSSLPRSTTRSGPGDGRIGPAPPVPGSTRSSGSAPSSRRGASPNDVLNRSRAMDAQNGLPGSRSSTTRTRRPDRPTSGAAPADMDSP